MTVKVVKMKEYLWILAGFVYYSQFLCYREIALKREKI